MGVSLDHVVLWCADPLRSVDFYERVVGLPGERVDEYREGRTPFPSVRISPGSLIDLMSRNAAPAVDAMVGADGAVVRRAGPGGAGVLLPRPGRQHHRSPALPRRLTRCMLFCMQTSIR